MSELERLRDRMKKVEGKLSWKRQYIENMKPKITKNEGWTIDDNGRIYRVKADDLFSISKVSQIATYRGENPYILINGKRVECKLISVYKDRPASFRSALPRTAPQFLVIRLDNGKKVQPRAEFFTVEDPGAGR